VRILLVTATAAEIGPVVAELRRTPDRAPRIASYASHGHDVDVLVTGVGMVATATWCSRALTRERYDLALNLGVCGSFDRTLPLGTVVHVVTDRLAELGAEDGESFLTIQQLQLLDDNEPPFVDGRLVNHAPPRMATLSGLRTVDGITVSTVHGREPSIASVTERFSPQVESMEGAAFMYACLVHGLPFAQVRAVSNVVERRNRDAWTLTEAIANLGASALRMLGEA
jgi:futalosine hydrolase